MKHAAFAQALGRRLRRLRQMRGLSQAALADLAGAELEQISRYERGLSTPHIVTAALLAKALRVSMGKLVVGEEDDERAIAATQIRDGALLDRFRDLQKLDRADRNVIITLIDAMIAARHAETPRQRAVDDDACTRRHAGASTVSSVQ